MPERILSFASLLLGGLDQRLPGRPDYTILGAGRSGLSGALTVCTLLLGLTLGCDTPNVELDFQTTKPPRLSGGLDSNRDEESTRQQMQSLSDPSLELEAVEYGLPDNALGAAIEEHLRVASGDGTRRHHETYFNSILALKDFPETVLVLADTIAGQVDPHVKLDLVYVLADLDDCTALPHLESIALRSHPELGPEPCHNCERENEVELYLTLHAITGVSRLLSRSCNTEAEDSLEVIALHSQTPTGRWASIANLKIEASRSQESLEQLLPEDEKHFAAVRAWNADDERSPEPIVPSELDNNFAPDPQ